MLTLAPLVAHAADLTVSAAASLTNAFKELGPAFEAQNPGTTVVFNFAASDAMLAQIVKGAPADVFASADQERAIARGLIALYRVTQKRQVWGPHQQSDWRTTA